MIIDKRFNGVYWGEDVEQEARQYLKSLKEYNGGVYYPHKNKKVRTREGFSDFLNVTKEEVEKRSAAQRKKYNTYWGERRRRMREGYGGLCGLHYGYLEFCELFGNKGYDYPVYRRADDWLYYLIESLYKGASKFFPDNKGKGMLMLKRRRYGWSTMQGWFILMLLIHFKKSTFLATSKTEDDASLVLLSEKIKHPYNNMPYALKPSLYAESKEMIHLGVREKDEAGNRIIGGKNSKIVVRPAKPTAAEGLTLSGWVADEIFKTPNFLQQYAMTDPALFDGFRMERSGILLLGGVAGDFDAHGEDGITMWNSWEEYNLIRVFITGWEGDYLDKYGNEDVEKGVRKILQKRNLIFRNKNIQEHERKKSLVQIMQQFPLTPEEALLQSDSGRFNEEAIREQIKRLEESPVGLFRYKVYWDMGDVRAEPSNDGRVVVLEPPKQGANYIAGIDPYGFKQKDTGSDGGWWIFKLANNALSPLQIEHLLDVVRNEGDSSKVTQAHLALGHLPVAYFGARYPDPNDFAEEGAALMQWYWKGSGMKDAPQGATETEPGNVLSYLLKSYRRFVAPEPLKPGEKLTKQKVNRFGITKKGFWSGTGYDEFGHYIDKFCDRIYFMDLLKHALKYDETSQARKYDDVDAMCNVLIWAADPRTMELNKKLVEVSEEEVIGSLFGFRRK